MEWRGAPLSLVGGCVSTVVGWQEDESDGI